DLLDLERLHLGVLADGLGLGDVHHVENLLAATDLQKAEGDARIGDETDGPHVHDLRLFGCLALTDGAAAPDANVEPTGDVAACEGDGVEGSIGADGLDLP